MFKYYIILVIQIVLLALYNVEPAIRAGYITLAMLFFTHMESYEFKKGINTYGKELIDKNVTNNKVVKILDVLSKCVMIGVGLILVIALYNHEITTYYCMQALLVYLVVLSVSNVYKIYRLYNIH